MSIDSVVEARRALAANRFDIAMLDVALDAGSGCVIATAMQYPSSRSHTVRLQHRGEYYKYLYR